MASVVKAALSESAELRPIFNLEHFSRKSRRRHLVAAVLAALVRKYSPKLFQPYASASPRSHIPKLSW